MFEGNRVRVSLKQAANLLVTPNFEFAWPKINPAALRGCKRARRRVIARPASLNNRSRLAVLAGTPNTTAAKLPSDDLVSKQNSLWKWFSRPENRFWHRFYHGFGSETKKPLKMIFAPWKSFLVPFLPWLWLRNKKALENDFRTLKIVWGTISTMALVSKQRSPWKWFSHPENRLWHCFYHGLPRYIKKDWTRTGSNRFAQRTEPNRTVTTWNRTEPIHFTNRTADIPVSQNRNEPNRTGGFLI